MIPHSTNGSKWNGSSEERAAKRTHRHRRAIGKDATLNRRAVGVVLEGRLQRHSVMYRVLRQACESRWSRTLNWMLYIGDAISGMPDRGCYAGGESGARMRMRCEVNVRPPAIGCTFGSRRVVVESSRAHPPMPVSVSCIVSRGVCCWRVGGLGVGTAAGCLKMPPSTDEAVMFDGGRRGSGSDPKMPPGIEDLLMLSRIADGPLWPVSSPKMRA